MQGQAPFSDGESELMVIAFINTVLSRPSWCPADCRATPATRSKRTPACASRYISANVEKEQRSSWLPE
jgi:hypothetical protein